MVNEIAEVHKTGRPLLVGTISVEKSEYLSDKLSRAGIPHQVLNAKFHELEAEIEAVKDEIKAEMNEGNNYELHGTDYKITWHEYSTSRIDSKALKKDLPEIAEKYTKETKSRRFLLA